VVSSDAKTASQAANAYAKAFTDSRKAQAQAQVRAAEQVIQKQLDSFVTTASKQSADYITLQQRLQDLQILEATVDGNFRVLVPATTPIEPFSPRPMRDAAIGFVAALVLFLDQFDTRIRTPEEARSLFNMPALANIRKLTPKALQRQPLYVNDGSRSPAAEAVRKLRGNLEFADIDGDLGSLFITSCLQHEGKTLTVCNLALSIAASGRRVVLVDADLRRPQVHRYFGLVNVTGLTTVLTGKSELASTLQMRSAGPSLPSVRVSGGEDALASEDTRLHVLTSGPLPPNPSEMIASRSFARLIEQLHSRFELVIVDAPALLAVGDTAAIARCVDGVVFLVDLTQARRPLLVEAAAQLSQMPCRKLGLVMMSSARTNGYSDSYYAHEEPELSTSGGRIA
jgi:tyrosine-protein kinase